MLQDGMHAKHLTNSVFQLALCRYTCLGNPKTLNPKCLAGVVVPAKKQAIGWRVAVYWPEESTLHDGEIIGFDNVSLRHHVRYDSGDHEHVSLDATKASCACCSLLISSELKRQPLSAQCCFATGHFRALCALMHWLGSELHEDSRQAASY